MANYIDISGMTLADIMQQYPQADAQQLSTQFWLGGNQEGYLDPNTFQWVSPQLVNDPTAYYSDLAAGAADWDNMFLSSPLYNPNGTNTQQIIDQANATFGNIPQQYQDTYNNAYSSAATGTGTGTGTGTNNTLSIYNTTTNTAGGTPQLTNATVQQPGASMVNGQWRETAPGVNTATFGAAPVQRENVGNSSAGVLPQSSGGGGNDQTFLNRVMNAWDV